MKILYFHGFASAGSTGTAINLRNYLYGSGVEVLSPDIPVRPSEAVPFLQQYVQEQQPDLIIGTSMGAMYAELQHGYPRILVNPSFQMSRTLTFHHMGKNVPFQNPRKDGALQLKVDKALIEEFRQIEKTHVLKGVTPSDRSLVWGIFGNKDRIVNFQKEFQKAYGKDHFRLVEGEHSLCDAIVRRDLMPIIKEILHLS